MSVQFDDIKFEAYISGAWVNLTPDVLINPSPRWSNGILSNSITERLGSPCYLSFSLDNSEKNSAAIRGYYSPGTASCLANWTTGIPVRLSFQYQIFRKYKFYGHIMPDGITVHPGIREDRQVEVTVGNYFAYADRFELSLMDREANKYIHEAINTVTSKLPFAPLQTDYQGGVWLFPTVFDTMKQKTTASAELTKLAKSEMGFIYTRGDIYGGETLVEDNAAHRDGTLGGYTTISASTTDALLLESTDYLLLETGERLLLEASQSATFTDDDLLPGTVFSYGKNLCNRADFTVYPRRVDSAATTILYDLQQSFELAGNATKTGFFCRYRDPSGGDTYVNGMNMRSPTTDDFRADTSDGINATTDVTLTADFGAEGVSYDFLNLSSDTRVVSTLNAVGMGIYLYDAVTTTFNDSTSQLRYGVVQLSLDQKYQIDPNSGSLFAFNVVTRLADPLTACERATIVANKTEKDMFLFMQLEPGDKIEISETMNQPVAGAYYINGYEAEIRDGKNVFCKFIPQIALTLYP